ncbi:MAG: SLC13 family permease [Planctomycetes bacterium]|nr:SLC13 family permease [Planctomycetota bacterium]
MELSLPQAIVVGLILASLIAFLTDRVRYDMVAIGVVLSLALTKTLEVDEAFAGFSSPAVVLVASMYAFSAAVGRNGIAEVLSQRVLGAEKQAERGLVLRVVLLSALLSSVLSTAAIVATMIPVLGTVSKRASVPLSRMLMPMSLGALLGDLLTLISTSKNVAVNGIIEQSGGVPFTMFEFTAFGALILLVGVFYFLGPGLVLLPRTKSEETLAEHYGVPKFITEILVDSPSVLVNQSIAESRFGEKYGVTILGLVRADEEATVMAPSPHNKIRANDVLLVQGTSEAILRTRQELGLHVRESVQVGPLKLTSFDVQLVEAVLPAGSPLAGRTLAESDFRALYNLNILGIAKHGSVKPLQVTSTRLDVGDTLLIQGHTRDIERAHKHRKIIALFEHPTTGFGVGGVLTLILLAAVLVLPTLFPIHPSVAALLGAVGLVALRCLRPVDALRAQDFPVLLLLGGMLALGAAFEKHGLGAGLAEWMAGGGRALGNPMFLVGALLVGTTLLTQLINSLAAAAIMTPVALALASEMGVTDRAFLMAVLSGASFAFMSPVAHQGNTMIMGPGQYRYRDFLRVGTPLTILVVIVATVLIPLFWPIVKLG